MMLDGVATVRLGEQTAQSYDNACFRQLGLKFKLMRVRESHHRSREPEPNVFDYVPKNVWREVYRGRSVELGTIQKAEFIVEIVFFTTLIGAIVRSSYLHGNLFGLFMSFAAVWLLLGAFFLLLTRCVR
jgi:hypothetical protein